MSPMPVTLKAAVKRGNDLTTISNCFILLSTSVRNLKPFRVKRNRSRTRQTHSRDITNILQTSTSWFALEPKIEGEKNDNP